MKWQNRARKLQAKRDRVAKHGTTLKRIIELFRRRAEENKPDPNS